MNEDELTDALIGWYGDSHECDIFVESHYNYYGNRGVVDLYVNTGWQDHIFEIKSEAAVREATGANEIIRQFNKTREFFFRGTEYSPSEDVIFELCFVPTKTNFRHILDNSNIYNSAVKNNISGTGSPHPKARLTMRTPDRENITPIIMFSKNMDMREMISDGEFREYVKTNNHDLYEVLDSEIPDTV